MKCFRINVARIGFFLFFFQVSGLLVAEQSADVALLDALRSNDVSKIAALIDTVSDVDLAPADGRTALMFVSKRDRPELAYRLLRKGADPNATNANGGTPLMYAAIAGNVEIVTALYEAGADINARGSNGWSALMVAAAKGHAALVSYLVTLDVEVDTVDVYSWTPLVRASYENRVEVVSVLIASGGASINHADDQGATSLHHAAGNGFVALTETLLAAGADTKLLDNNQLSAFDRALEGEHVEVLELLCQHFVSKFTKTKTTMPASAQTSCGAYTKIW